MYFNSCQKRLFKTGLTVGGAVHLQ